MLHRTARLTPFGRRLLVDRVLVEGWSPAIAAETLGVSRATAYKWLRRYRAEGAAGLEDRTPRPRRRPRALPEREVRRILRLRRRLRVGPHRLGPLLGHPRSTVYSVLRRHGVSRRAHADRLSGVHLRYVRGPHGWSFHLSGEEQASESQPSAAPRGRSLNVNVSPPASHHGAGSHGDAAARRKVMNGEHDGLAGAASLSAKIR
jgi:transposase